MSIQLLNRELFRSQSVTKRTIGDRKSQKAMDSLLKKSNGDGNKTLFFMDFQTKLVYQFLLDVPRKIMELNSVLQSERHQLVDRDGTMNSHLRHSILQHQMLYRFVLVTPLMVGDI